MTLDDLLEVYYRSVGRGVQLLLNVPPDRTGHMDPHDFARAKQFGDEIRSRFGKAVGRNSGMGKVTTLRFSRAQRVDHVVLRENCRHGQRVLGYRVEGLSGRGWKELATGSSIGFKRIQPLTPATVHALRLVVTSSLGTPYILELAAYDTHAVPPMGWNDASHIYASVPAGYWSGSTFHLDITRHVPQAAQYLVHFSSARGHITDLRNVQLLLDGVPESKFVQHVPGSPSSLLLDITAIGQSIELTGTVVGAAKGSVRLQKL